MMRSVDSIPCVRSDGPKVTCGILFNKSLTHFTSLLSDNPLLLFASGMATGEAEKIYLGACSAAMFRPSADNYPKMVSVCVFLSGVYGLEVSIFNRDEIADEIWLHNSKCKPFLSRLLAQEEINSPAWHIGRGLLCGIPFDQIDVDFHLRKGYRENCDEVGQK